MTTLLDRNGDVLFTRAGDPIYTRARYSLDTRYSIDFALGRPLSRLARPRIYSRTIR